MTAAEAPLPLLAAKLAAPPMPGRVVATFLRGEPTRIFGELQLGFAPRPADMRSESNVMSSGRP